MTFLFITNDGTPEGEMFNAEFEIDKTIKSYLDINKLSSFWNSDIESDVKIKDKFKKFGLEHFFNRIKPGAVPEMRKCAGDLKKILGI